MKSLKQTPNTIGGSGEFSTPSLKKAFGALQADTYRKLTITRGAEWKAEDGRALADAIKGRHTLNSLQLNGEFGMKVKDDVAIQFFEAFSDGGFNLLKLDLYRNKLTKKSMPALCALLKTGPPTRILVLAGNPLQDSGVRTLLAALQAVPRLGQLDLGNTGITEAVVDDIISTVQSCKYLRELRLHDNKISPEGCAKLLELMKSRRKLRVLNVEHNKASSSVLSEIRQLVKDREKERQEKKKKYDKKDKKKK
mmetsp:Transcript_38549/g.97034  ORF Transcript_38549/g.97034 Transcript_38549/m.97034 type:complete len:252 (-) Transcript_38549:168-923(-)